MRNLASAIPERELADQAREAAKILLARHEVGFAIHFGHRGGESVGGPFDHDDALSRDTRGLLVRFGQALAPHEIGGSVEVAPRLHQRLLAFHHAGARALAQLFDRFCRDCHRH